MLFILKVTGSSMLPVFQPGDFVLISRWFRHLQVGDDVVINHPHYGRIIKRIACVHTNQSLTLTGLHASSVSSTDMGTICPTQVVGKVRYTVSLTSD
ncbi:S24 family peptidase [Photobacterium aphoticum]|uniref:Peptidase S24/S26A/S26B/S26C domain-containing protein n=1 Tax=Photobacterium aphoticum TaxID=754436 RepID=A0A0J1GLT2_9GAMM|nr:S24 family peptidase [Photobacterium aphoticum]KLV00414.1 hypothetical protein ABT58_12150 [Photobacterium aphoticum]PSU59755.1 peptidase S24 [Photobacterium aphoticum]GHA42585.1 hypothetical protein GCM10007086_15280 [Photobacterium aphoticum]